MAPASALLTAWRAPQSAGGPYLAALGRQTPTCHHLSTPTTPPLLHTRLPHTMCEAEHEHLQRLAAALPKDERTPELVQLLGCYEDSAAATELLRGVKERVAAGASLRELNLAEDPALFRVRLHSAAGSCFKAQYMAVVALVCDSHPGENCWPGDSGKLGAFSISLASLSHHSEIQLCGGKKE